MRESPLQSLLWLEDLREHVDLQAVDVGLARCEADLATLERALSTPGVKTLPYLVGYSRYAQPVALPAALLRRAEAAERALWSASGSGKSKVEEGLLRAIARTGDPSSLPFLQDAIAYTKPRDTLTTLRRTWAIAALALMAVKRGSAEASAALDALLAHHDLRVRAHAVEAIARTRRTKGGRLQAAAARLLERVAREDASFEPRFIARLALHVEGLPIAAEPPGGVYAFEVTFARASRTVELTSEQTLSQLVWPVAEAFGWESDHLYAFEMSDEVDSELFTMDGAEDPWSGSEDAHAALALPVGALGLRVGQRFGLLYDFGASHRAAIRVSAITPKAEPRAKYPRVVRASAKKR